MEVKYGDMIVVTSTEKNGDGERWSDGLIVYVTHDFPVQELYLAVEDGYFTVREATLEEKEICYLCYEHTGCSGCNLKEIDEWRKIKNNLHEHLHTST